VKVEKVKVENMKVENRKVENRKVENRKRGSSKGGSTKCGSANGHCFWSKANLLIGSWWVQYGTHARVTVKTRYAAKAPCGQSGYHNL